MAPDARVVPLRVLDASGSGSSADVAAAFDAAGRMGVRVVNASLGGGGSSYAQTLAIRSHPGTLYVVASGNDGRDVESTPTYPCAYPEPNVLCVGATDNRDALADFSNYGSTSVDLFAPGVMIASAWTGSGYRYANGTSMASPQAAGVAALLASRRPTATAAEIKAALMGGAAPVAALAGRSVTDGRLDAVGALDVLDGVRLAARVAPTVTATPVAPAPTAEVTELPSAGGPDTVAPGSDTPTEPAPASVPAGSAAPASPAPRATVPSVATPRAAAPTPAAADPETRKKAEAGVRLGTPKVSGTGRNRQLRFTVSRSSHVSVRLQRRVCRGARCHWTARAAASTAAARAGTVRVRLGERYAGVRLTRGTWRAEVLVGSVVRRAGFRVR